MDYKKVRDKRVGVATANQMDIDPCSPGASESAGDIINVSDTQTE